MARLPSTCVTNRTPEQRREELIRLFHEVRDCRRCPLGATRTNAVFGMGNADADLMFVGEAPGAEEDRQGKPFVGRAGKLLDQLLGEIGLNRKDDAFICNVLKSRPPGNRDPQPDEIEACRPYLETQIALIEPLVICTLGNFATKLLTGSQVGITRQRGGPQERELGGRPVTLYPLFHPAAALRTPQVLEQLRQDFAGIPDLLAHERKRADERSRPSALAAVASAMQADDEPEPVPQLGLFGQQP
jgi:uracil-DNA glycosylase